MSALTLLCPAARRRRSNLWPVIAACLLLIALMPLPRAVAAAAGLPLDLDEAVRLAERDAPVLIARESAVRAAALRQGPAGEWPVPELVLGVENLPIYGSDAWNWNRDEMTMRKIGLMQTLPRREKRELRRQRAEADREKEWALLNAERLSLRERIANAWIAAASAEQRLERVERLRVQADALVDATIAAISAGRGSTADAIAARQAQGTLADRIAIVRLERDQARMALAQWLPNDAARPLAALPDWRTPPTIATDDPERIDAHRDLQAYDAMTRAAVADIALARAEKHPDWSVELAYGDRGPHLPSMLSLEFRVGLPLFATRRQDPLIAANEAVLLQLESEREATARERRTTLIQLLAQWQSARARADRYEHEWLPLSEERNAAALAAYRGGAGRLQDVLDALDTAVEHQIAYIDVRETLGQAWSTLQYAFPEEP